MGLALARKGYMRTIEAFLAFFITFLFVVFIVLKGVSPAASVEDIETLSLLEQRDDFRGCVFKDNVTCLEEIVDPYIPDIYAYAVSVDSPIVLKGTKDIYTETLFMTSDKTGVYHVVYVYHWSRTG